MSGNDVHSGHRSRIDLKTRLMGLEFLEEHEQLEKLLFAVIPRGNTNGTAHALLNEFGSIYGVLTADTEQLKSVEGVGQRTAEFLHDLLPLLGIAERSMLSNGEKPLLNTAEKLGDFIKTLFYGKVVENLYMISLNSSMHLIRYDKISEGTSSSAMISLHDIAKKAILNEAYAVVLAHNHPGGNATPSLADLQFTQAVTDALHSLDIILADHFIVAGGKWHDIKGNLR